MTSLIGRSDRSVALLNGHDDGAIAAGRVALLSWYDLNKRDLPWRKGRVDPYRIWVSEVMLQQTTVPHALPYFERFMTLWPRVQDLAGADDAVVMAEWAGLGYYSRARNLIKCARIIAKDYKGVFPNSESELLKLPSFGPYTAAALVAFGFGKSANVVDGNIERVMSRLYAVKEPLPAAKTRLRELSAQWIKPDRPADWPQALMDLANMVCRPRNPSCDQCPLSSYCAARAEGEAETYPRKDAKPAKPQRYGVVFVIESDEGVIVERRADKGLLGGMLGLPHTPWSDVMPDPKAVEAQRLIDAPHEEIGSYQHVFTHFALHQKVWRQRVDKVQVSALLRQRNDLAILPLSEAKALPTVFRKALKT